MNTILNILWLFLGAGIPSFIAWFTAGIILSLTIVGIPFAIGAFRISIYVLLPFGYELVDKHEIGENKIIGTGIANLLWILLAGIWLALIHIIAGIGLAITIIGIPFAIAHFKIAKACFSPLGKYIIHSETSRRL
ncbi:MAG: hypothetical protein B6226_00110 [Candidatus Cloacimonetes bacterium 4572_65]|nr:MAG: hypothetical protein B6226_00110 [Candidatus Cloacimonetes bacterium 4572_65]